MEINGMAHVILTAGDYGKSTAFYRKLLPFLGMAIVFDSDEMLYGVGGRTALGVRAPSPVHEGERFVQSRAGLHHLCFRARERADVDALHEFLLKERAKIVHAPEDGPWAPGYYSVLFEDPDGVRLEMNQVPGKGLLDAGGKLKGL